jgi:hypothetical protein
MAAMLHLRDARYAQTIRGFSRKPRFVAVSAA